ncbi:ABC transporter ATP-binding protein [Neorhizobium sp. JUb45]|uniref:ABC transporter ATP-binding protein n=1 Tax=Neorhizobium sp. JUb45 TaxID=2485113 RepID=UPI0010D8F286|nr:ABC transporter ATP-binding protein [Neorhizobium sp. JUb45]TCQ99082.1 peptide/nickel transport system ATP-binding protein [Neorhizobium sp. JUb45]
MTDENGAVAVLAAHGITVQFNVPATTGAPARTVVAVEGLDLSVGRGETLAIVGESGSGKSATALALTGLLPPNAVVTRGEVGLMGERITNLPESAMRRIWGNRVGLIFQDPMSALNPVLTIGEQIQEAILAHRPMSRAAARAQAEALLAQVKLPDPAHRLDDYPHQLSGGMRQRVMIAIAISNHPDVLIADEPTTALDATVQMEILSLLKDIQAKSGMAIVLITHDLGVVARWADRVVVMYGGRKMEEGATASLLLNPSHPYTRALIAARPSRRPATGRRHRLSEIATTGFAPLSPASRTEPVS